MIVAISNWIVIPIILVLFVIFTMVIKYYLKTTLELRRLEQLAYSPILTNLSECYQGLSIFRSLDKVEFMN